MEYRKCEDCGKSFLLPIAYNLAPPTIRNKCIECISIYQRNNDEALRPKTGEWFT